MTAYYVISADSQMMEPANLSVDRLDHKFKDRAGEGAGHEAARPRGWDPVERISITSI